MTRVPQAHPEKLIILTDLLSSRAKTMLSALYLLSECFVVLVCIPSGSGDRLRKKSTFIIVWSTTIYEKVGQGQRIREQALNPYGVQAQYRVLTQLK